MNNEEYNKCIEFINALREFDSFTTKTIGSLVGKSYEASRQRLLKLRAIGVVLLVDGSKRKFAISNSARQILAKHYAKETAKKNALRKIQPKPNKRDFDCSMVTVIKANVKGMGSSKLKQLDSLLSGVRV